MNVKITNNKFWYLLGQTEQEIRLVLAVKDREHRKQAQHITDFAIPQLMELLPGVEERLREKALLSVLRLVNWQGRHLIPKVLEELRSMNEALFPSGVPVAVLENIKKLEQLNNTYLEGQKWQSKETFLERLTSLRQAVARLLDEGHSEKAYFIAVATIYELASQLPKIEINDRRGCRERLESVLALPSWREMGIGHEYYQEVAMHRKARRDVEAV